VFCIHSYIFFYTFVVVKFYTSSIYICLICSRWCFGFIKLPIRVSALWAGVSAGIWWVGVGVGCFGRIYPMLSGFILISRVNVVCVFFFPSNTKLPKSKYNFIIIKFFYNLLMFVFIYRLTYLPSILLLLIVDLNLVCLYLLP